MEALKQQQLIFSWKKKKIYINPSGKGADKTYIAGVTKMSHESQTNAHIFNNYTVGSDNL